MSHEHHFDCHLLWTGASRGPATDYASYARELALTVHGKAVLQASAAPPFRGDGGLWNPEDMLVASLVSCHCLSYLALATRARISVLSYEDDAHGTMDRVDGRIRFTRVVLRPKVTVARGTDLAHAIALHDKAHHECFIASSVNFPVVNEPRVVVPE